ncbi:MAG: hypothetical protein M1815_000745 [Lichina confinis]|nr:MAG: hypothetical protein M1815_000745 [Lichina confinis]
MRLFSCSVARATLGLLQIALLARVARSQGVLDAIPQCYQDCIEQSGDFTCNGLDIKCLCRLSNGNFLTNVITCIRAGCDNKLNTTSLVGPVAETCEAYGVPIAPAAIENAKSIGASLEATATTTLTEATTLTSTIRSAGTMYVIAYPLTPTSGPSGVRTISATPRTVVIASISGGDGLSITPSEPTSTASDSDSDSDSAAPENTAEANSEDQPSEDEEGGAEDDSQEARGGSGSPFGNSNTNEGSSVLGSATMWLTIGTVCLVGISLI